MRVTHLVADRFRNLEPLDLPLDALYVLATLKPLRSRRLRELVRFGETTALLGPRVVQDGVGRALEVDLGPGGRIAKLDGKVPSDLGEYFAAIRAVSFVPSDGEIVTGEPA